MSLLESRSGFKFGDERYEFRFTADDFNRISNLIYHRAGVCLPPKKTEMVYGRLSRRLRVLELNTFAEYLDLLTKGNGDEWGPFIGALTTHLTSFFREEHHFRILAGHAEKKAGSGRVKLWSCAASTGEEPYSMAITMAEQFGTLYPPVDILATDVDPGVIETARGGVYPIERIESLPDRIVRRYFLRGGGDNKGFVKIRPELLQMITFAPLNLLAPVWSLTVQYDAIFCRNVMIYFDRPTQKRVLQHTLRYLKADGLFFAGHSENLNHLAELFEPCGNTVYRPHRSHPAYSPEPACIEECYV
ncbi:MAG: chemotaxis protein CheR [Desulfuromonadaceae bacterium]|nr:chemotaxis protein CheR [Desulfuromonadaceae bacterium]